MTYVLLVGANNQHHDKSMDPNRPLRVISVYMYQGTSLKPLEKCCCVKKAIIENDDF
jgi:hypothetical protein